MPNHATKTDGVWRVYRYERPDGNYVEVASNEVGPEAIPLPPGYRFAKATEMVSVDALLSDEAAVRAVVAVSQTDQIVAPSPHFNRGQARAAITAAIEEASTGNDVETNGVTAKLIEDGQTLDEQTAAARALASGDANRANRLLSNENEAST